jgi:hypothetical protein
MYVNGKMRPSEAIPGIGGWRDKGERWAEGENSTTIYCKNFCKCYSVPPAQQ